MSRVVSRCLAGRSRDVLDVDGAARPRVIEQDAESAVLGPGGGDVREPGVDSCRERHRSGRGNRGDGRHSFFSVTSHRGMIRDFPCVARWGMPRVMISYRHDTGAWLNAAEDHALGSGRSARAPGRDAEMTPCMALEDLWI